MGREPPIRGVGVDTGGNLHHRTVAQLMTSNVVRARRGTPFKEIDVTAVPVVDELDRPRGVVSEAGLLRRSADKTDCRTTASIPHRDACQQGQDRGFPCRENDVCSRRVCASGAGCRRSRPSHGGPPRQAAAGWRTRCGSAEFGGRTARGGGCVALQLAQVSQEAHSSRLVRDVVRVVVPPSITWANRSPHR